MTPTQLAEKLTDRALDVCMHLLPNGKREGKEWRAGSLAGDKGQSLGVCLQGDRIGVWQDFATGETGGDLLDLWASVNRCGVGQAMAEAKKYLGIHDIDLKTPSKKEFTRPEKPKCHTPNDQSPVNAYLASRGLKDYTIQAFKIGEESRNIIFPFLRNGSLIHWKKLGIDRPNGKKVITASSNCEPCLFGWQALPDDAREVIICEGEIDCMTAWQYGYPALSVPMGGGAGAKQDWIEYEYLNLERFDTIYLCLDNDEAGQLATNEIIKRLGRERCKLLNLGCKDFNYALVTLKMEKSDIDLCYQNAKHLDPEKLINASEFKSQVIDEFYDRNPTISGMELPWEKVRDLIRFRGSELSIWTGWSGHGKSQLLNYLAFHGVRKGIKFCIASMEMPAKRTLQRMVKQAAGIKYPTKGYIGAILDYLAKGLWIYDQVGSANTREMIEAFKYSAKRYGVNQFIVDSLAKLGLAEDDYNGQKVAVEQLIEFAHEMDVHVHLVAHPRKADDESHPPGKLDVRGGAIITDLADNVLTVWRNKKKEQAGDDIANYEDQGDVRVVISKQRLTGEEGKFALWFDKDTNQYFERKDHRSISWVNYEAEKEQFAYVVPFNQPQEARK